MRDIMCFARGHEGSWEALCADFDIAVQGASFDEVRREIDGAVRQYISFAEMQDEATKRKLLSRRAPWHVRIGWIALVAWHGFRRDGKGETPAAFPVACAA